MELIVSRTFDLDGDIYSCRIRCMLPAMWLLAVSEALSKIFLLFLIVHRCRSPYYAYPHPSDPSPVLRHMGRQSRGGRSLVWKSDTYGTYQEFVGA